MKAISQKEWAKFYETEIQFYGWPEIKSNLGYFLPSNT
jgi:hypothetical protein